MARRDRGAMRIASLLLACSCLAPVRTWAAPGPLDRARAAQLRVDYEGALREVDDVLAAGGLGRADLLAALLLRGELLAALGRDAAVESYVEALAIDVGATVDAGISPRARGAFAEAVKRAPAPVRVRCRIDRARGLLHVELERGASRRATLVRVERRDEGRSEVVRDQVTPPAALVLPGQASQIECAAIDRGGSVVAEGPDALVWAPSRPGAAARAAPAAAPDPADPGPPALAIPIDPEPTRPAWRSPWVWGGAAAVTGAAALTFSLLAARDQRELDDLTAASDQHEFAEAEAVRARGESRATWANVLWIGTGVLAVAAGACLLWAPEDPVYGATVRLELGPGAVGVAGSF